HVQVRVLRGQRLDRNPRLPGLVQVGGQLADLSIGERHDRASLGSGWRGSAKPPASRWLIWAAASVTGRAKRRRLSPFTRCTGPATDTAATTAPVRSRIGAEMEAT